MPVVIDAGAWHMRAGWAGEEQPALAFRSVLAKTRREKGRESELLVGSDISNMESVRHCVKSAWDRDVVTHLETMEQLLDHGFSRLGLDTEGAVAHPVFLSETLGQPSAGRHLSSQLMFELYSVPALAYGVDCLHSLHHNQGEETTALVISLGHTSLHVVAVVEGRPVLDKARRINLGAATLQHHLQRTLQLKYPAHAASLTLSRAEQLLADHTRLSTDFFGELKLWRDSPCHYDSHVRKIQLPYTVQPRAPPPDPEVLRARRQELARRLVEINARKRDERCALDEVALKQMVAAREMYEQGYEMKFSKALARLNLGLVDIGQLEAAIEKVRGRIEKAREARLRGEVREERAEPELKRRREDMGEEEGEEFDVWLEDVRAKYEQLRDKRVARQQRRQQLAKRRTAASQERMRIISQLARNTKGQDTFGQKDEDWDVYKQISREAGDSDSEEEGLRAAEYEAVLKEHEPQEEEVARDSPEWHQVRLTIADGWK